MGTTYTCKTARILPTTQLEGIQLERKWSLALSHGANLEVCSRVRSRLYPRRTVQNPKNIVHRAHLDKVCLLVHSRVRMSDFDEQADKVGER